MTKTVEEQEKFIELRARGFSFDRIAEELQVSKPVLLKWSGELSFRIKEAQYYELENLLNQYKLMRIQRAEVVSEALSSALQELKERATGNKFKTLQTEKLVDLVLKLEERLEKETRRELLAVPVDRDMEFFKDMREKYLEVD